MFLRLQGQITDGEDAFLIQEIYGGFSREHQIGNGQGPEDGFIILPEDDSGGVRFFVIRAHLREDLVVCDPDRDGNADLFFYTGTDAVRQFTGAHVIVFKGPAQIQIGFIDGCRLDIVCVTAVNGVDPA